jgi:outer membrane protein assembly factor BamB
MSITTTVVTPGRKGSRYLAWGLWTIVLCGAILVSISNAQNATDTKPPQATLAPPSGSNITKRNQIVVKFSETMNTTSLALGGDMAAESDGGIWLARVGIDDNTLAISPKNQWNTGSQKALTIDAADLAGNPLLETLRLTYAVDAGPDTTPPTANSEPASGSDITQNNKIVISFNESMSPESLALGGDMAAESDSGIWSTRNNKDDTLTISPRTQWNADSRRTLIIDKVTDIANNPLATLSLRYTVTSQGTLGVLRWRFETGYEVWSSPAIGADGTLYVGSKDNHVYALNPNGTQKWRFKTGNWVRSSPAIGAAGTLYVGSLDGNIYALNPDGTLKWRFQTDLSVDSSPAIGVDGTIYVGGQDTYVYSLNPNGTLKWRFKTGDGVWSSPAIGADGTIYVGSGDNYIYALNPDGTLKWQFETGYYVDSSPAIGIDGTIYVASGDEYIYALNPDGTLKWRFQTGNLVGCSPTIGVDGTVFVGSRDDYIYALNPDGTQKWRFETSGNVEASPTIGGDGTIYVGSDYSTSYLYALNPDGTLKWRLETSGGIWSSPALGADGTIYIGLLDNDIYAIHGGTPLSTAASWPKFHQNNRNTGRVSAGKSNNHALVVDSTLQALLTVDLSSGDRSVISSATTGAGPAIDSPYDVALDRIKNRVLIVQGFTDESALLAVDLGSGDRTVISSTNTGAGRSFTFPVDVALDSANNRALVVDEGLKKLLAVDLGSGDRTVISSANVGDGPTFRIPDAVALDSANNRALVADRELEALLAVDLGSGDRTVISDQKTGTGVVDPVLGSAFNTPVSIALDSANNRALVLDEGRIPEEEWIFEALLAVDLGRGDRTIISNETTGAGPAFGLLDSVALDSANNRALVVDRDLAALLVVDLGTSNRTIISNETTGAGPAFGGPTGVALDTR